MIRLAFGSVPKDGGTFTFYRNMRPALLEHGIDMRCVAIGREQADLWEHTYADDGCILLAKRTRNIKKQAQTFADWCDSEQIDIVMGINSEAILSALPHLPQRIRCMSRCANSFDHGYRITLSGYARLTGIIAQTPRQLHDLTECYGADPAKITVIPNGIDPAPFQQLGTRLQRPINQPIRLAYLGRLEHKQKGVLFIPDIVQELNQQGVNYELRIAGKGRHEAQLKAELTKMGAAVSIASKESLSSTDERNQIASGTPQIKLMGALSPIEIPAFLADADIFLFPSQFEGCPNALLEAMMAGCVPVAWTLTGITDFIIKEGLSGYLAPLGAIRQFSNHIAELAENPARLAQMQNAAAGDAYERFRTEIAAIQYATVFHRVMEQVMPTWSALEWSDFRPDPNFAHSWKDHIPSKVKTILRNLPVMAKK